MHVESILLPCVPSPPTRYPISFFSIFLHPSCIFGILFPSSFLLLHLRRSHWHLPHPACFPGTVRAVHGHLLSPPVCFRRRFYCRLTGGCVPLPTFEDRPSMVSGPTAPGPSWTPDTSQGPSQPLEGGGWRLPWAKAWFSLLLWARAFASFSTDAKKASNSRVITHIKKKNPNSIISSLAQIQRKATLELQSHISHASTCARAHAHTHVLRQPKWHFLNLTLNGSLCDDDCLCFKFELCLLKASFFEDRLFCSIWHNELLSWAAKTIWIPWAAKINWMLQNNWIQLQKIGQEKTEKNVWLLFPQTTGNRAGWSAGLCPWLVCKPRCYNLMVWKL